LQYRSAVSIRSGLSKRLVRSLCTVAVITGVATIASTADSAIAQTPANSIPISVAAPAAIEPEVDLRLLSGGTDVTYAVNGDNNCTEGAACSVLVAAADISVGPVDPPADTDGGGEDVPVGQLPETGVPCSLLALIGAALVLTGLALLGIGGRRRPTSFGV
jgi:hypothetical protein